MKQFFTRALVCITVFGGAWFGAVNAQTTKCDLIRTIQVGGELRPTCFYEATGSLCPVGTTAYEEEEVLYCTVPGMREYRTSLDLFLRDEEAGQFYRTLPDYTTPLGDPDDVLRAPSVGNDFLEAAELSNAQLGESEVGFALTDAPGQFQLRQIVKRIMQFFRRMFIPIAVLLVTIGGVRLMLSEDADEGTKKTTQQILIISGGFVLLNFAFTIVETITFGRAGEILRDTDTIGVRDFAVRFVEELGGQWYINPETNELVVQWGGILAYIESFVIPIAVLIIVINAVRMLTGGATEDTVNSGIKRIGGTLSGIFLFYVLRYIVNFVTTRPDSTLVGDRAVVSPTEYTGEIVAYLTNWTNYVIGFLGLIGVAMMIYGGARWVMSYMNPDQVETGRKTIIAAIIGLVLAFSAFVIVRYIATPFAVNI